jgi:diguanylate cyclase (GGDEF)-like protein
VNTCLIKQGETSEVMYIVKSGRFKISRWVESREVSFAEVGSGDVIGEMTLIAGGKRSASVTALKPSIVYKITKSDIHNNRFNIPKWFLRIIQQLIARIRDSEEVLDKLVKKEEPELEQVGIEIDYIPDKSMAGIFKLNGELTAENRASFKNQIIRLINSGFFHIILDFSNITSIDESYLLLLDKIAAFLISKNGKLHFTNTNPSVAAMLKKGIPHDKGRDFHENLEDLITPALLDKYFDQLTGLYSQDYFQKAIIDEVERCRRYKSILSILSIRINYSIEKDGLQKSDTFLQKEIAAYIKSRFRKVDITARTADKLFQIILPGTDVKNAKHVAEQFCEKIKEQDFKHHEEKVHVFCHCGISTYTNDEDAESLLARSRAALYEAKKKGKNKIAVLKA